MRFVTSFYCNIHDGEDISGARHGTMLDRPFMRCLVTCERIQSIRIENIWVMAG